LPDWYHDENKEHEHQDHQPRTLNQNHEDQKIKKLRS
jgi:hypothetical protein